MQDHRSRPGWPAGTGRQAKLTVVTTFTSTLIAGAIASANGLGSAGHGRDAGLVAPRYGHFSAPLPGFELRGGAWVIFRALPGCELQGTEK
ncbi:hypothetical protein P8C59_006294 [Phyllachora maydis]|uniref:Uncharacterized protein n=1 Tax=Phyllachora maydis TaxID=1825666 RepID=A0AAD9MCD8_9PEZI|nr:hypothetical protein P8C59_006294 [Phyllachora maydis]